MVVLDDAGGSKETGNPLRSLGPAPPPSRDTCSNTVPLFHSSAHQASPHSSSNRFRREMQLSCSYSLKSLRTCTPLPAYNAFRSGKECGAVRTGLEGGDTSSDIRFNLEMFIPGASPRGDEHRFAYSSKLDGGDSSKTSFHAPICMMPEVILEQSHIQSHIQFVLLGLSSSRMAVPYTVCMHVRVRMHAYCSGYHT